MPQNTSHHLVEFVCSTFGKSFGDLLLAGYNEERSWKRKKFYILEEVSGVSIEWEIEVDSKSSPIRHDPLVLAALLKLLLHRPGLSFNLEFEMSDLVKELGWADNRLTYKAIDRVLRNYVSLFYHKELSARMGEVSRVGLRWGHYSLINGYFRVFTSETGASPANQTYHYVDINREFVEGLKIGQVSFADINFGQLYPTADSS